MGWKDKLCVIDNSDIAQYLKGLGFYESTMSPRFYEGDYEFIKNKGIRCLRFDVDYESHSDWTLRIFVSKTEIYVELETGWRGFGWSRHKEINSDITREELDELLDEMTA